MAGAAADGYERHGYTDALRARIEHGVFGFCGAHIASTHIVHDSESTPPGRARGGDRSGRPTRLDVHHAGRDRRSGTR